MSKGFVKKYMTVPEVAEYFSLSPRFVYDLVQQGKLKAWHPAAAIGTRGMRVSVESVQTLETTGAIDPNKWSE